jgi:hypothetical protein
MAGVMLDYVQGMAGIRMSMTTVESRASAQNRWLGLRYFMCATGLGAIGVVLLELLDKGECLSCPYTSAYAFESLLVHAASFAGVLVAAMIVRNSLTNGGRFAVLSMGVFLPFLAAFFAGLCMWIWTALASSSTRPQHRWIDGAQFPALSLMFVVLNSPWIIPFSLLGSACLRMAGRKAPQ